MNNKTVNDNDKNDYQLQKTRQKSNTLQEQIVEILIIIGEVILMLLKFTYHNLVALYRLFKPKPLKSVKGEHVLITGAGHGIGKQLALAYSSSGATVICLDINKENLDDTVKEINSLQKETIAYSFVCDVSNRDSVLKVAQEIQRKIGDVTILINNAGIMPSHPIEDHTPEEIRKIMDVNVFAHFWTIEAFLPAMKRNGKGHIVAMSSIAGLVGLDNLIPYCASKYAVRGLMEGLQEELRLNNFKNIKTTTLCPYMVNTGLCKNPIIKFNNMMALLEPAYVAKEIMYAQRTNAAEITIPRYLMKLNLIARLFPFDAMITIRDFFASGVASDIS